MASRFTDTELWNEDWFCEMPGEYQHFTKYMFDKCDNAGVWKPNKYDFETKTKFKVSLDSLFEKVNKGAQRVLSLNNGRWFITGYILFQWFNKKKIFDLVLSNKLHRSLHQILIENEIPLKKVRGLREVLKTSMVMVMDNPTVIPKVSKDKVECIKGENDFSTTKPQKIEIDLKIRLPGNVLEAAEMNQYTLTKKKNTEFIECQWLVFLHERMNDPDKVYLKLSDLTSHFLNWIRNKHPKNGTHQPTSKRSTAADNAAAFYESARAEYNALTRGEADAGG